jgi:hypothetical protein
MDELRLQAVAARVAAWHNQHPFAYRITPQHVHSVGYVVLPYAVPGAAADATVPTRRWQAAFVENFIAPLTTSLVARWARRHGRVLAALPTDAPLRVIATATAEGAANYRQVVVMSAAIDVGTLSTRVLMGAGTPGAVIGPRLWHGQRLAAGAGAAAVVMLALSWFALVARVAPSPPTLMAVAVSPQPKAVAAAASVSAVVVAAPASAAASAVAAAPTPAAPQPPAAAPADVQPQTGRVAMPTLAGLISDEAKAEARAHRKTLPSTPAAASAAAVVQAPASATREQASTPRFALTTRLLRTRAEAEQFQAAMSALLRSGTVGQQGKVQTDILPEGEDWRVVGMPFVQRDEAEKTRRLLMARGMRVDVINF